MTLSSKLWCWIDLETTGLDSESCVILEVAVVLTDQNGENIIRGPNLVIGQPFSALESMNEWCTEQHTKTGLITESLETQVTLEQAETEIVRFLETYVEPETAPLCGSSISFDRAFLKQHMPRVLAMLHYRNIDTSTLRAVARAWIPGHVERDKTVAHRAAEDIIESVAILRHYKELFLGFSAGLSPLGALLEMLGGSVEIGKPTTMEDLLDHFRWMEERAREQERAKAQNGGE